MHCKDTVFVDKETQTPDALQRYRLCRFVLFCLRLNVEAVPC